MAVHMCVLHVCIHKTLHVHCCTAVCIQQPECEFVCTCAYVTYKCIGMCLCACICLPVHTQCTFTDWNFSWPCLHRSSKPQNCPLAECHWTSPCPCWLQMVSWVLGVRKAPSPSLCRSLPFGTGSVASKSPAWPECTGQEGLLGQLGHWSPCAVVTLPALTPTGQPLLPSNL